MTRIASSTPVRKAKRVSKENDTSLNVQGEVSGRLTARPKVFSTGSKGFFGFGRLRDKQNREYMVTMNIVRVHSREED